jgi:ABC-type maltose transport system permease subunit
MLLLARLVRLVAAVVVAVIVIGILLVVLGANESNSIVSTIHDWASWLTRPFHNVFHLKNGKTSTAVNWGLAAVVYAVIAAIVTRLLVSVGAAASARRPAFWRRRGTTAS